MAVPHYKHITLHTVRFLLPNYGPVILGPDIMYQSIYPLYDFVRTLSPWTAILPDIPRPETLLRSLLPDLRRIDALVVSVVPLANVLGDGDPGVSRFVSALFVGDLPGIGIVATEIEEFERLLRAGSWRDISKTAGMSEGDFKEKWDGIGRGQ